MTNEMGCAVSLSGHVDPDGARGDPRRRRVPPSYPFRGRGDRRAPRRPPAPALCRSAGGGWGRARRTGGDRLRWRSGQLHGAPRRPLGGQGTGDADGRPALRRLVAGSAGARYSWNAAKLAHHGGPCLDAGKGEIYVAGYVVDSARLVREVAPGARLAPAAFGSWAAALDRPLVAGNGAARHRAALVPSRIVDVPGPTAVSVGRLALLQRARGEASDLAAAVPFYGRPPDITVKKHA